MIHDFQFVLSSSLLSSTTSQTLSQPSPPISIAPPTLPTVSGNDGFYIIIAIAVLVRVIISPPDRR